MSRDMNLLHSAFRPLVDKFLADVKAANIDLIVTCTYRTAAEQDRLFAQGRTMPGPVVTRARAGQSAHNFGLAIDVVPVVDGKCCWNEHDLVWQQIGSIGQGHGMIWYGSPGAKFPEYPHFEMPNWEKYK